MKTLFITAFIGLSIVVCTQSCSKDHLPADKVGVDTLNLRFVPEEEAASLLRMPDEMSRQWTRFDIFVRLKDKEGTKEDLLAYAANQARDWTEEGRAVWPNLKTPSTASFGKKTWFSLPERDTRAEYHDARRGWCRRLYPCDYIVLIDKLATDPLYFNSIDEILAHESFHVLTRNNPELRKRMLQPHRFSCFALRGGVPTGAEETYRHQSRCCSS